MVNMVKAEETHLTKRQFEVLRMKVEGKTLSEISRALGTSRANVSRLARVAEHNIELAKNTLRLVSTIRWPVRVEAKAGSNIYEVSDAVFSKADESRIRISRNYAELVRLITEALGRKNIRRRKATKDFTIFISGEGKVEVLVESGGP
ncbi:MAG: Tfx family DNA-binding protein [Candidatus Hadarchaeota archaeon]